MILPKFSKRERTLLITTIAIVLATILYGFIIEPFMNTYSRLDRDIEAKLLKLQKGYKMLRRQSAILAEYEKFASSIKPIISDEEEQAAMLKTIEATARGNNIYITNIRPQPIKDMDFYKEFVFELIAEADMDLLMKFIYELQTSGNLLRVTRLTISSSAKKKGLKAVMEITKPSMKTATSSNLK